MKYEPEDLVGSLADSIKRRDEFRKKVEQEENYQMELYGLLKDLLSAPKLPADKFPRAFDP